MESNKEYTKKRNEILDVAERLFLIKGYEKCTINNILDVVGIAKGTFYYYFKSKEEVLDLIINRVAEIVVERAESLASNSELSPEDKLFNLLFSMRVNDEVDDEFMEGIHKPENALMHQKSLMIMVTKITPIFEKIVNEGIIQGIFKSEFPRQYVQIFLTSSITLLDDGIFQVSREEQQKMIIALLSVLDKMLGLPQGTFWKATKDFYG